MANIFRIWGKKANTKEQMETVGQELADEQLKAVIGGCGGYDGYGQSNNQQSYGEHRRHHHHNGNNNSCQNSSWQQPCSGQNSSWQQPCSGQNSSWQSGGC